MISWFIAFSAVPAVAGCIDLPFTRVLSAAGAATALPRRDACYSAASAVSPPWPCSLLGIVQIDIEAERAHFLDQHVEAFRNARLERVVAAHDRLVDLGAAGDVVRLDGQHLLQRVGGAVGFERPHFHFAETLAAELRLAAQRLLGDQRVRADRAGVDLVVHQVVQLEHVDVADRDLAIERFAGAAVEHASPGPSDRGRRGRASSRCRPPWRRRTPASRSARRGAGCRRARSARPRSAT